MPYLDITSSVFACHHTALPFYQSRSRRPKNITLYRTWEQFIHSSGGWGHSSGGTQPLYLTFSGDFCWTEIWWTDSSGGIHLVRTFIWWHPTPIPYFLWRFLLAYSLGLHSFPGGSDGRIYLQGRRPGFHPWVRKIPWRKEWLRTPVFLPGEPNGRGAWRATIYGVTKRPFIAHPKVLSHRDFLLLNRMTQRPNWNGSSAGLCLPRECFSQFQGSASQRSKGPTVIWGSLSSVCRWHFDCQWNQSSPRALETWFIHL